MRRLLAIVPILVFFSTVTSVTAANPEHLQRLLKTNQCPNCDLSNADLKDTNLFGANLINANLRGAILKGSNLGFANFTNADLSGANLEQTYLDRATFENANLTQADLVNAYLKNASMVGVKLNGATLRGAKLQNVNLVGVSLQGLDLREADLSKAQLTGFRRENSSLLSFWSDMNSIVGVICQTDPRQISSNEEFRQNLMPMNLSGANLSGANLSEVVLLQANLTNANLSGANLQGTCLSGSNLKGATLDRANLQSTIVKGTILDSSSAADPDKDDRQLSAKNIVGTMMRSQQAYFLEYSKFATNDKELGVGLKDTEYYAYRIFSQGDRTRLAMVAAVPKVSGLRTYLGLITTNPKQDLTVTRLCVSQAAKPLLPKLPLNVPNNQPASCPTGFQSVK